MTSTTSNPFDALSPDETLKKLNSDIQKGLTSEEVQKRLAEYGENRLVEKKESLWKKLFSYFWGPIPWMIETAAILSAFLQKWPDFVVIISMLLINGILGFIQEYKAGNAIDALKKKLALHARVLRDGLWQDIAANDLVPGDIIMIKLGNIIPADIKLLSGEYLSVDQSAMTGESLPVTKKVNDSVFSGTIIKMGEMIGIVTTTGMNTFFGKTAKLISSAKNKSHFQEIVLKIGNFLILVTLAISFLILMVSLYRMKVTPNVHETLGEIIIFVLVLVVAGIPIALPAVLSATMAIGAHKLAKLKAIVSKLTAVEELAGMDILCSDKTGTLTKNELIIGKTKVYNGFTENDVLLNGALASSLDGTDSIDLTIINSLTDKTEIGRYNKSKFIPFDPVSKKTEATITTQDGKTYLVSKGAPQVILKLTQTDESLKKTVENDMLEFAKKGYRSLGVAKTNPKGDWEYMGMIPLFDPPRDDTKETLERIKGMGVDVKMVTGDHESIAKELATTLDMRANILPVRDLHNAGLSESQKEDLIENADGFAEVFPEHKFEIVKTLQRKNHIVGMTGDGVNDAPALKQANIGIAVSGATDAAKAAADLVLTEPGLLVIGHAIEESRRIFGRMKSYAMYRISETVRLLLFLLLSIVAFNDHPLTAIMIILIALLNDIPIMMISYDHMRVHTNPVTWNIKEILTISIGLAVIGVISTFGLFWIGDEFWFAHETDPAQKFYLLRTLAFMGILCGGNLTIYLTRNIGAIWQKPLPEIKFFSATIFSQIIGTLISVYGLGTTDFVGIGWKYVGLSWAYILFWFGVSMIAKKGLYLTIGYKESYLDNLVSLTSKSLHTMKEAEKR